MGPVRITTSTWWFYVKDDVTIDSRVTCHGTVNLILEDEAKLTVPKGITVQDGTTFNVYVRTTDESKVGTLIAGTEEGMWPEGEIPPSNAGIGGIQGEGSDDTPANAGNIVIRGGNVQAWGTSAGIGNGAGGNGGSVTIYSGTVTATGQAQAAGVGNGETVAPLRFTVAT